MDVVLDRRKHDDDVIERVLGGMRDLGAPNARARVFDIDIPWISPSRHPFLELTVGIDEPDHKAEGRRARG